MGQEKQRINPSDFIPGLIAAIRVKGVSTISCQQPRWRKGIAAVRTYLDERDLGVKIGVLHPQNFQGFGQDRVLLEHFLSGSDPRRDHYRLCLDESSARQNLYDIAQRDPHFTELHYQEMASAFMAGFDND